MALAGCVFDQDDLAGADMTRLAVAGGDRNTACQTDHILPSGRSVPAVFIVGGGFAEHDAGRRQALRQLARGRLLDPVDLNVAEMRLAIGILVKVMDTHRSTLLYLPTIPGFGPRGFDFPHQSGAEQQNWPAFGVRRMPGDWWSRGVARVPTGSDAAERPIWSQPMFIAR